MLSLFAGIFNTDDRVETKPHFAVLAIFLIAKTPFFAVGLTLFKYRLALLRIVLPT